MSINGSKLLSGRVPVTPYANLAADRHEFLNLSDAEPSLGAGNANSVLTLSTGNTRVWSNALNLSGNITANVITANTFVGNIQGNIQAPGSNTQVLFNDNNITNAVAGFTFNKASNAVIISGNVTANVVRANTSVSLGNTAVNWATLTTSSVTANQTIATLSVTGVTGIEFLVKGIDAGGNKYSMATVQAVTNGTSVDYSTFGGVQLGGFTGSLAVNIAGSNISLQVTPASSNSTVWTTQYRII